MNVRKAVFPVAGFGTRFLPATKAIPKEMLPLVDKPIIQYVVEEAKMAGLKEIIMVTGMGKTAIEDHFDTSFELELFLKEQGKKDTLKMIRDISRLTHFSYTRQKRPRGLGDAIYCSKNIVGMEPFAVLLGDDVICSRVPAIKQMLKIYNRHKATILAVQEVPENATHLYGIVRVKKVAPRVYKVLDLVEKPEKNPPSNLAIVGRYLLTPEIFGSIEMTRAGSGGEIQLTDAIRQLLEKQHVYAYEFEGERYDAGDKLGFLKANVSLALKRPDIGRDFKRFLKNLHA